MPLPARARAEALALLALTLTALLALTAGCGKPLGPELIPPRQRPFPADAIVVLGNRPPLDAEGNVAPETARRVERGVELFREGLAPILVVAGGPAPHGGTEADVMARHAIELGVPPDAIRREARSRDTAQNAGYTVAMLCGGRRDCAPSLIVVSAPYHLRRAARLFECAGGRVQTAGARIPDDTCYQASFTAYEYAARFAAIFDDPCARAASARAGR